MCIATKRVPKIPNPNPIPVKRYPRRVFYIQQKMTSHTYINMTVI